MDVSPSDCLLLAVNTSIKEMTIYPSYKNRLDQSLVLQLLKQLKHNYTLGVLLLGVTREAEDDEQFIRDVEILVEDMTQSWCHYSTTCRADIVRYDLMIAVYIDHHVTNVW